MGRLGRESTLLKNGEYIKDLSYLNRPAKDIVYVDFTDEKCQFHKGNVLILPKWEGDREDRELYDIMPFLEDLAMKHGQDTRKVIAEIGNEGTGRRFRDILQARRSMIMN